MKNSKVMRDVNYGMYIVSAKEDRNVGCVINTFCQITSGDNPIITISLNKDNYTNQVIQKIQKFAVSILSEEINPNVISTFGFSSSKEIDKFSDVEYKDIDNIPVLFEHTTGYVICEVEDIIDCGTHDIFIARVIDGDKVNDEKPMSYSYYHEVVKGKAPKNAPTYVEEKEEAIEGVETYKCSVCGYVVEGPIPDDFICPICGRGKEVFKRI